MSEALPTFPIDNTIISEYAHATKFLTFIEALGHGLDAAALFNSWFDNVWDIDTAQGVGLDVWGRIVGVSRILQVPTSTHYFGFVSSVDGYPFDEGVFYNGLAPVTQNYPLTDTAYRRLIYAKAKSNIWDGSIPGINEILMRLFSSYGNCYAADGLDMTITYTFQTRLSPVDFAIVTQSGAIPRPAGVSALISMP